MNHKGKKKNQKKKKKKPSLRYARRKYHIIITSRGKQLHDIYSTYSEQLVNKKFSELLEESKKVLFPVQYLNMNKEGIVDADYELVIIKKKEPTDNESVEIRNEYGNYVEYISSNEGWVVYDSAKYNMEETFYVYGYHPTKQRKTCQWIFKNFFLKDKNNKYNFKSVHILKNKLIIDTSGNLDMVLCKNKYDASRLYTTLVRLSNESKLKYVMFSGDISKSGMKTEWYKRLMDWTGWSYRRITRHSLRP